MPEYLAAARRIAEASAAAQGYPPTVTDESVLYQLARLLERQGGDGHADVA
ncbi:MAG TPA: hypothetical protein VEP73_02640 [Actinomycetota bacterium]|nr:hypothetical protein [Actinomycetota bacterium]